MQQPRLPQADSRNDLLNKTDAYMSEVHDSWTTTPYTVPEGRMAWFAFFCVSSPEQPSSDRRPHRGIFEFSVAQESLDPTSVEKTEEVPLRRGLSPAIKQSVYRSRQAITAKTYSNATCYQRQPSVTFYQVQWCGKTSVFAMLTNETPCRLPCTLRCLQLTCRCSIFVV